MSLVLGVVCWAGLGCGGPAQQEPDKTVQKSTSSPLPLPQPFRFVITEGEASPTSLALTMRWTGGQPLPIKAPWLMLCLPAGRQATAHLDTIRLGSQVFTVVQSVDPAPDNPQGKVFLREAPAVVQASGIMRRWPVSSLRFTEELISQLRTLQAGAPQDVKSGALEMDWRLTWDEPFDAAQPVSWPNTRSERLWSHWAGRVVENPAALERYAVQPVASSMEEFLPMPAGLFAQDRRWGRFFIEKEGLYALRADDLLKAGFSSDRIQLDQVRLFWHGQPVPVRVVQPGQGPRGFEPGVYFWASPPEQPFTAQAAYWVTLGEDIPPSVLPAVQRADGATSSALLTLTQVERTVTLDRDQVLRTRHGSFMALEGMEWVDEKINRGQGIERRFDLPGFVAGQGDLRGSLDVFFDQHNSVFQAHVDVQPPVGPYAKLVFYGSVDQHKEFTIPAYAVRDGATSLTLRTAQITSSYQTSDELGDLWLNRLSLTYWAAPQLYDGRLTVSSQAPGPQPTMLQWASGVVPAAWFGVTVDAAGQALGIAEPSSDENPATSESSGVYFNQAPGGRCEFFAPSAVSAVPSILLAQREDLSEPPEPVDLLIVVPSAFRAEADKLADFHRSQNWRVKVVNIQAVFDRFNYGESSPWAVRRALEYALAHWQQGPPAFVLLMGDCSSDYLNQARSQVVNWIPTFRYADESDQFASDYWMTTVAGQDDLPEFSIGRLSVANAPDAARVVEKIMAYSRFPKAGPWRARLAYVADNGDFAGVIDNVRASDTPEQMEAERIYLDQMPLEDNWYLDADYVQRKKLKVSPSSTVKILETLRSGVTWLTYYGHGSPNIWADERIWFGGDTPNSDNLHLEGSGYCTFVANMTCNSGAIDYPLPPWNICITEDMMRVEDGGAIACYVPSGPGVTFIHRQMSEQLRRAFFVDRVRGLGEATTLAKIRFALQQGSPSILYMYLLLGDPLVDLQMTLELARFELGSGVCRPGGRLMHTLEGVEPAKGRYTAELVDGEGETLWSSPPADYRSGKITLDVDVPSTASAGVAHVRVYAWNPSSADEVALAAPLEIIQPSLELKGLTVAQPGRVSVTVANGAAKVPGEGELEVWQTDGATSRSLGRVALSLPAGASPLEKTFELKNALATGWLAASLTQPGLPPLEEYAALPPANPAATVQAGWIQGMCRLTQPSNALTLSATAYVYGPSEGLVAGLMNAQGEMTTTRTLDCDPQVSLGRADFPLTRADWLRLKGGRLWLGRREVSNVATMTQLDALALDRVRIMDALVAIVPGSLKLSPANPTEGQTIFVDFDLENRGLMASDAIHAGLYDRPARQGGRLLDNQMQVGRVRLEPLLPGQRRHVQLRCDPVSNAGEQSLCVEVQEGAGMRRSELEPLQVASLAVQVRTKSQLAAGKVWSEASQRDQRYHRMQLKAQVFNHGQTDARRVMVSFYRSKNLTPDNKLGEVELDCVPALGETQAELVWKYDPARDIVEGGQLPEPIIQIWLKGSSQRLTSLDQN